MLIEIIKPNCKIVNENGVLIQLVRNGWNQVNVIHSKKNSKRGGHFHKINREAFYIISGKFRLDVSDEKNKESYTFGIGDMFIIQPYVIHNFEFMEDTILVSMYDKGVELPRALMDIHIACGKDD